MNGTAVISLYMTFPDEDSAAKLARTLLLEGLVACVNILPAGRSLYAWQGEIRDEEEVVAFAKTTEELFGRLAARFVELHPYETPCLVSLRVQDGLDEYLRWVAEATGH